MKSNTSKLSAALFGIGLLCGLLLKHGDFSYTVSVTLVGIAVFYVTDTAVRNFGPRRN